MMGRPPKPLADHELDGTLRESRHGGDVVPMKAGGYPEKPTELTGDAAWFWDFIVERELKNVAARIDTPSLIKACRWYARAEKAGRYLDKLDDGDKDQYRATIIVQMCDKMWDSICSRFGMTPVDRMRLRLPKEEKPKGIGARQRTG